MDEVSNRKSMGGAYGNFTQTVPKGGKIPDDWRRIRPKANGDADVEADSVSPDWKTAKPTERQ